MRTIASRSFIFLLRSSSSLLSSSFLSLDVVVVRIFGFSTVTTSNFSKSSPSVVLFAEATAPPRKALGSRCLSNCISNRSKHFSTQSLFFHSFSSSSSSSSRSASKTHRFTSARVNPRDSMSAQSFLIARAEGRKRFRWFFLFLFLFFSSSFFETRSRTRFSNLAVSIFFLTRICVVLCSCVDAGGMEKCQTSSARDFDVR